MTDLEAKYQKLATEFSKLRAQVPVLKKALIDEQGKENQLKIELKEKDACIRRFTQEMDSLNFRNQQLTARIESLQRDMGQVSSGKVKKPSGGLHYPVIPSDSVLSEELQSKISENARLHTMLSDAESLHADEISVLQDRIIVLECAIKNENLDNEKVLLENRKTMESLEGKNQSLLLNLNEKNSQILNLTQTSQMKTCESRAAQTSTAGLQNPLPFSPVTALQVEKCKNKDEAFRLLCSVLKEFELHASLYHQTSISNLAVENATQFDAKLLNNLTPLSLHEAVSEVVKSDSVQQINGCNLTNLIDAISYFKQFSRAIHDFQRERISSESSNQVQNCSLITESFVTLDASFVEICALCTKLSTKDSEADFARLISNQLEIVCTTLSRLLQCYSIKFVQSLAFNNMKVNESNNMFIMSLSKYLLFTCKLSETLKSNMVFFCELKDDKAIDKFVINADEVLQNQDSMKIMNLNVALKKELLALREQLVQLEQEKDHWRLESELRSIKLKKLYPDTEDDLDRNENQQETMQSYFSGRILQLFTRLQQAQSKCLYFEAECTSLQHHLVSVQRKLTEECLASSNATEKTVRLQEELATTRLTYEGQLSLMSEHLASMNEKLASQQEEIDVLTFQLKDNFKIGK